MSKKAWIISVNMGYGHQRTAFPLKDLAPEGKIINANDYVGIPEKDRDLWEGARRFYELISSFKKIPLIGEFSFYLFDKLQKIFDFYPRRNLSGSNYQLKSIFYLIAKKGWGLDLIQKLKDLSFSHILSSRSLPPKAPALITTFFSPAFMAEFFNYPGEIFCVICDADISRTWVSLKPGESRIKYFAPTIRVVERLKLYGVKPENIFLTGYPLPQEMIGGESKDILKNDLRNRIVNLDPKRRYFQKYRMLIEEHFGVLPAKSDRLLTLLFSVGGAGAQKELGEQMLKSLSGKIKRQEIRVILSVGIKENVKKYFDLILSKLGLTENVEMIFEKEIERYFQSFNQALRKTDILWTKPSELSFYSALGLPIIIAPPIGSQEEFNMRWLLKSGFGLLQENPRYAREWLFDWVDQGYLAEAAMQGYVEGSQLGSFEIKEIIGNTGKCSG